MKKRIIERLEITDIEFKGKGVGRTNGKVIFVDDALPGETVDAHLFRNKKEFGFARPVAYHKKSDIRIEPFCRHFAECGGCTWQNIPFEKQLEFKAYFVQAAFERIGHFNFPEILPIIPCDDTRFYRNKLEFTFSDKRWLTKEEIKSGQKFEHHNGLGFHKSGSFEKVLDIEKCFLQPEPSNEIRQAVRKFAVENNLPFFKIKEKQGLLRNLIIRNSSVGEVMVILSIFRKTKEAIRLLEFLKKRFPRINSLNYVVNDKRNDTITDLEIINFSGKPYINEKIGDIRFRIGPKSFLQTNSQQAKKLYDVVVDFAELHGTETLLDLYTGIGSIALYLAKSCKKVIGIELIEEAIKDAEHNAALNGIKNVEFFPSDVKDIVTSGQLHRLKPDLLIVDPPRAGMHPKSVEALLEMEIKKIIYVSCNPTTQARDLNVLDKKYNVLKVQPVDMFPQTYHIENVVLLELNRG